MRTTMRSFIPLVILAFFTAACVTPCLADETSSFVLTAPDQVTKGDTFDLLIKPVGATLDQNDVTLILPPGFDNISTTPQKDGSISYKIKAPSYEGAYDLTVNINSKDRGAQTLTKSITVQQSFFEAAQPYLIATVVIIAAALLIGGMTKSGGSGGSVY